MSELRLVPAALAVWAVILVLLSHGSVVLAVAGVAVTALILGILGQGGQATMVGASGAAATLVTWDGRRRARSWEPGEQIVGEVATAPVEITGGGYLVRVDVSDLPAPLPVFTDELGDGVVSGSRVVVEASLSASDRPGLLGQVGNGDVHPVAGPSGMDAVAHLVRESLGRAVETSVGEASQGLIPGMVLGDTSGQTATDTQLYIDTGLSHLTAVSGANVAIVTTAAVLVCRLLTLGPRVQVGAAVVALAGFVGLVGTEPSVLRASVTGLVGLLAVINSTRMEPIHGLCLAVIGLLLWDPDLAVAYGFALSVAATAGIIALFPLLYRPLARTGWPDILVRAIAVAVAADLVTMPIIALMAGRVSMVSVLANVLVAPAVAPVTVLGLIAAGLSLLPGGLATLPLMIIEPCTWWIHTVATWCADLPNATVPASPAWVLVGYGWVLVGVISGHPLKTAGVVCALFLWAARTDPLPPVVPLESLRVHHVPTVEEVGTAPPGTQVIVVEEGDGRASIRPTVTREGIPVLFPQRDGPVTLHVDGTQHAADGRF